MAAKGGPPLPTFQVWGETGLLYTMHPVAVAPLSNEEVASADFDSIISHVNTEILGPGKRPPGHKDQDVTSETMLSTIDVKIADQQTFDDAHPLPMLLGLPLEKVAHFPQKVEELSSPKIISQVCPLLSTVLKMPTILLDPLDVVSTGSTPATASTQTASQYSLSELSDTESEDEETACNEVSNKFTKGLHDGEEMRTAIKSPSDETEGSNPKVGLFDGEQTPAVHGKSLEEVDHGERCDENPVHQQVCKVHWNPSKQADHSQKSDDSSVHQQVYKDFREDKENTFSSGQPVGSKLAMLIADARRRNSSELQATAKHLHKQLKTSPATPTRDKLTKMTPPKMAQPTGRLQLQTEGPEQAVCHTLEHLPLVPPGQWEQPTSGCSNHETIPGSTVSDRANCNSMPGNAGGCAFAKVAGHLYKDAGSCAFRQEMLDVLNGWRAHNAQLVAQQLVSAACSCQCCKTCKHAALIICEVLSKTPKDGAPEAAESRAELFYAVGMKFREANVHVDFREFCCLLQRVCRSMLLELLVELYASESVQELLLAHVRLLGHLFLKGLMSDKALTGVVKDLLGPTECHVVTKCAEARDLLLKVTGLCCEEDKHHSQQRQSHNTNSDISQESCIRTARYRGRTP